MGAKTETAFPECDCQAWQFVPVRDSDARCGRRQKPLAAFLGKLLSSCRYDNAALPQLTSGSIEPEAGGNCLHRTACPPARQFSYCHSGQHVHPHAQIPRTSETAVLAGTNLIHYDESHWRQWARAIPVEAVSLSVRNGAPISSKHNSRSILERALNLPAVSTVIAFSWWIMCSEGSILDTSENICLSELIADRKKNLMDACDVRAPKWELCLGSGGLPADRPKKWEQ